MASDTLSSLLEAVKHPSANLTENVNFAFAEGGGGIEWHLKSHFIGIIKSNLT